MKKLKTFRNLATVAMAVTLLASCGPKNDYNGTEVQGVSTENGVTTIKIGNTAATSGVYASVGTPFNYALQL